MATNKKGRDRGLDDVGWSEDKGHQTPLFTHIDRCFACCSAQHRVAEKKHQMQTFYLSIIYKKTMQKLCHANFRELHSPSWKCLGMEFCSQPHSKRLRFFFQGNFEVAEKSMSSTEIIHNTQISWQHWWDAFLKGTKIQYG